MTDSDIRLSLWTIYDNDGWYVAREWVVAPGAPPARGSGTVNGQDLAEVRAQLREKGLHAVGREPDDPPRVIETWV